MAEHGVCILDNRYDVQPSHGLALQQEWKVLAEHHMGKTGSAPDSEVRWDEALLRIAGR